MLKKATILLAAVLVLSVVSDFSLEAQAEDELKVMILASASDSFIREWKGSSYGHRPGIQTINKVEVGQLFYVVMLVNGYGVDGEGNIELSGTSTLVEPNGNVGFENEDILEVGQAEFSEGFLMFDDVIEIVFDETDPLGTYMLKAEVKDYITGKTAADEFEIMLVEKTEKKQENLDFSSAGAFSQWITYHYMKPEPEKIPAAIMYYADSSFFAEADSRLMMAAFFAAVFRKNPSLMNATFKELSSASINAKVVFLRSLWLLNNKESEELINKAGSSWQSDDVKEHIKSIRLNEPIDIYNGPIENVAHLDMLWTSFFATGDNLPVERIISVLHYLEDGSGMEAVIAGAAEWSLTSNASQHRAVYQICREQMNNMDNAETKKILKRIVDKVDENR